MTDFSYRDFYNINDTGEGTDFTEGYMHEGDTHTFKVFDASRMPILIGFLL